MSGAVTARTRRCPSRLQRGLFRALCTAIVRLELVILRILKGVRTGRGHLEGCLDRPWTPEGVLGSAVDT